MSGFLARLAARVIGGEPGLAPRPHSRFGPMPPASSAAHPPLMPRSTQDLDAFSAARVGPTDATALRGERPYADAAGYSNQFVGTWQSRGVEATALDHDSAARPHRPADRGAREGAQRHVAVGVDDESERLMPLWNPSQQGPRARAAPEPVSEGDPGARARDRLDSQWRSGEQGPNGEQGRSGEAPLVRPDAFLPPFRGAARSARRPQEIDASPSTVVVHIGRIDVRAAPSPAAPAPAPPKSGLRKPSLDAYLIGRERRRP